MSRCEIDMVFQDVNETVIIDKMWNIHHVMWLDEIKDETEVSGCEMDMVFCDVDSSVLL